MTSNSLLSLNEKIIPSGMHGDYIADVIGRKFDVRSKTVYEKGRVIGPLGLAVPLEWRHSHGHAEGGYFLVCWKVTGGLYITVAFETETRTSTIILMDKAKLKHMPKDCTNIVSAATIGSSKGGFRTLEGYVKWFRPMIIGVWVKNGMDSAYTSVAL